MGIAYGCLMAFGSYNQFHTAFVRDAFCLSGLNSVTSLIAGIIVFAAIGHTSFDQGLPIDRAATDGKVMQCSARFDRRILRCRGVARRIKCLRLP